MATDSVIVTGKVGGGFTMTAVTFPNVTSVVFDTVRNLLKIYVGTDCTDVDINAASTITATVSSGLYTFTIS